MIHLFHKNELSSEKVEVACPSQRHVEMVNRGNSIIYPFAFGNASKEALEGGRAVRVKAHLVIKPLRNHLPPTPVAASIVGLRCNLQ